MGHKTIICCAGAYLPANIARIAGITGLAILTSCAAPKTYKKAPPQKSAHVNNKTKFSVAKYGVKGSPRVTTSRKVRKGGGRYQVGKPYKIKNNWYYPKEQPGYNRTGMASWYGPNFHGRLTANGEVYDQYSLSAAHPTLPLPSYAKVTNLENNSSVIVRINDRGPFSRKRIIDLSAQASKMLGYQNKGLAKVRVKYIGKARMDGRDSRYLMASYKPGRGQPKFPGTPTYAPGSSRPGTLLASASMPNPTIGVNDTAVTQTPVIRSYTLNANDTQYPQAFAGVSTPIPVARPTRLYEGLHLDLANSQQLVFAKLQPISYLQANTYKNRIAQAFAAIDNNIAFSNSD